MFLILRQNLVKFCDQFPPARNRFKYFPSDRLVFPPERECTSLKATIPYSPDGLGFFWEWKVKKLCLTKLWGSFWLEKKIKSSFRQCSDAEINSFIFIKKLHLAFDNFDAEGHSGCKWNGRLFSPLSFKVRLHRGRYLEINWNHFFNEIGWSSTDQTCTQRKLCNG